MLKWPFWPIFPPGGGASQLFPESWHLAPLLKRLGGGHVFASCSNSHL